MESRGFVTAQHKRESFSTVSISYCVEKNNLGYFLPADSHAALIPHSPQKGGGTFSLGEQA